MRRLKALYIIIVSFLFFILITSSAEASLVTIEAGGRMVINVLSAEESIELEIPRSEYLEIKDIAAATFDPGAKISLTKEGEKVELNVSTASGDRSLDVTNYQEEIVEIEERPPVEKIMIGVSEGKLTIEQGGVIAETDFDINVDPENAGLTLETPSGFSYLSILPRQAVESVLRSKKINRVGVDSKLIIIEKDSELSYEISGEKVISLFNLVEYSVPVKVHISASTGEILLVDQPTWLRVLGFLLD